MFIKEFRRIDFRQKKIKFALEDILRQAQDERWDNFEIKNLPGANPGRFFIA